MSDDERPDVWPAWGRYTFWAMLVVVLGLGLVAVVRDGIHAATVRIVVAVVVVPALLAPVAAFAKRRREQRAGRRTDATGPERAGPGTTAGTGVTRDGRAFRIQARWKEEVVYWEGEDGYRLDAGWGVTPGVLYVPTAALWDDVVPAWLQGRREVVVEAMREHSGHTLADDDRASYYVGAPQNRTVRPGE